VQQSVHAPLGNRTVLVVDDEPGSAALCADVLRDAGYRVFVADDGQRALALALERRPDIVLTDLYLPHLCGDALIDQIRDAGLDSRVVLMSGAADGHVRAFRSQADAFLSKPFDVAEIIRVMARLYPTH
jgi:two-component system chemotaxis response regulator CheY